MRCRLLAILGAWGLVFSGPAMAVEEYAIDPLHSKVGFSIRNLLIGRVHGSFLQFSGKILYDKEARSRSSVEAAIEAWSVHTGNTMRDRHLRTVDFFNVAEYPQIIFRSSRVEKKGSGYLCVGRLSMHGVTREIDIPFWIIEESLGSSGKKRLRIKGELSLNRNDYGIYWNRLVEGGGLTVGNKVRVVLDVEAVEGPG